MPISVGDKLGPYEILARIGAGGMGTVWKSRDTRLDRIVAVKIASEGFTERFEREARAVAAFSHPNIRQLYDVGPNYLVMELVDGEPLRGPVPVEKAIAYANQILDALAAAHKKDIIHRDLKLPQLVTWDNNRAGPLSRHGNPIQVALHALAREGVYISSRAGRNVARRNYPRSWQLQDLLLRRKPMDDTFGYQMARGQRQDVGLARVVHSLTLHKQMFPVPGPPDLRWGQELCQKRSAAIDPEQYQTSARMGA